MFFYLVRQLVNNIYLGVYPRENRVTLTEANIIKQIHILVCVTCQKMECNTMKSMGYEKKDFS